MLIRSDTRYVPTAVNMIVLQGEDGAYYYLHRSLYDQCVILRDQYINLIPSFYKLLGFEGEHPKVCDTFMDAVPEPLDILAPFLAIITDCEKLDNIDDMCGAISSMSMSVDFRKMFKVPATVRASIKFSLSVREEYRVQWDRFFVETPTFEQVYSGEAHTVRSAPVVPDEDYVGIIEEDGEAVKVNYTGGSYSMDDLMGMLDAAEEAAEEEEEDGPVEVVAEAPKVRSGFAMLKGLR